MDRAQWSYRPAISTQVTRRPSARGCGLARQASGTLDTARGPRRWTGGPCDGSSRISKWTMTDSVPKLAQIIIHEAFPNVVLELREGADGSGEVLANRLTTDRRELVRE